MHSILVLSASVLIAVISAGTTTVNRFFDDVGAVKQHSFHPPLLINPTESGINAWSFGAAAVVTENYVRLTPATNEGHGYLWNQYPSELKAWRAHFSIRVAQRPHLNSVGVHDCGTCGVAFWALTEPTRHGDVPFFGVPAHFVGVGVVVHQEGTLHLVGKSNAQDDVSNIGMVSMGRCKLSLSSDVIDIIVEFSSADQNIKLSFMERDSAKPIHCAHAPAIHIPSKYYFGFTAYGKASSPVGYEVLAMTVTPLDGAQEKPIDLKQEQEAAQFDHALDEKEQDFWEANGDQDPEQKAKAEQVKAQDGHHSPPKEQVQDREIPHHAAELRRMPRGAHARDQATQHDAAGTEGDSGSGHADGHVVDEAPPADASGDQPTE